MTAELSLNFSIAVVVESDRKNTAPTTLSTPSRSSVVEETVSNIALLSFEEAAAARDNLSRGVEVELTTHNTGLIPLINNLRCRKIVSCVVSLVGITGSFLGGAEVEKGNPARYEHATIVWGIAGSWISLAIAGAIYFGSRAYTDHSQINEEIRGLNDKRDRFNKYKEPNYLEAAMDVYTSGMNLQILDKGLTFEMFLKEGKNHHKICDTVKNRILLENEKKDNVWNEAIKTAQTKRLAANV